MPTPGRRRLLAGSLGPERIPARPDATEPRWYEPLHVRDARGARERLAGQVAVGTDVVVAPTWHTHRRALIAAGETRQARAWTAAAVRAGREAIEIGLERRAESAMEPQSDDAMTDEPVPVPLLRPAPLLAASLPALDETAEPGDGRLLPRQAASERDYREQAGLLADAEPDLLLVEGQATPAEVRTAVEAALEVGLPVWVALSGVDLGDDAEARLDDALADLAVACLLLPGTPHPELGAGRPDWGGLPRSASAADAWLDAGAVVLGLLDGASAERLAPLRAAIDRSERAAIEAIRRVEDAWWAHVRRAASMAGGGAALWLGELTGETPGGAQLPPGSSWIVTTRQEAGAIPLDHFRLIVDPLGGPGAARQCGPWLERGGLLASRDMRPSDAPAGLRTIVSDDSDPPLVILRRET